METEFREATEKTEIVNRAKTEFLANVSHDVKTPLSGMIGMAELLAQRLKNEEFEFANSIVAAGRKTMIFFDNCLELAKLEGTKIEVYNERFNLRELIQDIIVLMQPAMQLKGLNFQIHCDDNIPSHLLGSRNGLYRTLLNIIGNAVKFTHQGSITLRIQLSKNSTSERAIIKIDIQDTGIGIPKDKQSIIFERLTRLTPSYEGRYEGSGIGLYIVDKLIKAMQGEIHVTSEEGKGTCFTIAAAFRIPLLATSEYEKISTCLNNSTPTPIILNTINSHTVTHTVNKQAAAAIPSSLRVLSVEDNELAQRLNKTLLTSVGFETDIAENGSRALELFQPGKYALIFMDIGLPDMDGCSVTRLIRNAEKDYGKTTFVPVIALTAHASIDIKAYCADVGVDGILNKPLSHKQLTQITEKFIYNNDTKVDGLLLPETKKVNTSPVETPTEKVIDLAQGAAILSGTEDDALTILTSLADSMPEFRNQIKNAKAVNDKNSLQTAVHKFYGGLCYSGTPRLKKATAALEAALKTNSPSIDVLYYQLLEEIALFEKNYQSLLASKQQG